MKFTFWDQLVLNITGRLPKKTQAEVDALLATKAMIARVAEVEHQARLAAAEKRKKAASKTSDTPKATKPKTTRKKKSE